MAVPFAIVESSDFTDKWGTPRQSNIVQTAAAVIVPLVGGEEVFSGTAKELLASSYSHILILFLFHLNKGPRDGIRLPGIDPNKAEDKILIASSINAKIRPPQLDGRKVGTFATRSPHRPCPIGLSIVMLHRKNSTEEALCVTGVDLIAGTPILVLRGYHPQIHRHPDAQFPPWLFNEKQRRCFYGFGAFLDVNRLQEAGGVSTGGSVSIDELLSTLESQLRQVVEDTLLGQDTRSIHSKHHHIEPVYSIRIRDFVIVYKHLADAILIIKVLSTEKAMNLGLCEPLRSEHHWQRLRTLFPGPCGSDEK